MISRMDRDVGRILELLEEPLLQLKLARLGVGVAHGQMKSSMNKQHGFKSPTEKMVYDVEIPETITVAELADRTRFDAKCDEQVLRQRLSITELESDESHGAGCIFDLTKAFGLVSHPIALEAARLLGLPLGKQREAPRPPARTPSRRPSRFLFPP